MTTRNILREFIDETLSEMMHPEHVRKALAMEIMEAIEEDQNLYNSMKEAAALEQDPAELAIYKQGLELITRTIEEKKQMLQSLFSKTMGGTGVPD